MRWIPFVILVYLAAALQSAHFGSLSSQGKGYPQPEFLILVAVFYAMFAAENGAILAGLLCGIVLDLLSSTILGTLTIPLALVCLLLLKVRLSVFRERWASQAIMAALAVMIFAILTIVIRWLLGTEQALDVLGSQGAATGPVTQARVALHGGIVSWSYFGGMMVNAMYTGVLAPFLFWPLLRMEGVMGFGLRGSRGRGH